MNPYKELIDTEMEMSGGADDGWYPLHMHVVVPEGAMYMDVGVEYVTSSAGHGGTVVLDEMGVFAPLTANTLTLSYDQALNHAIDDRVHHLSMGMDSVRYGSMERNTGDGWAIYFNC